MPGHHGGDSGPGPGADAKGSSTFTAGGGGGAAIFRCSRPGTLQPASVSPTAREIHVPHRIRPSVRTRPVACFVELANWVMPGVGFCL